MKQSSCNDSFDKVDYTKRGISFMDNFESMWNPSENPY